ncbi:MAG: hypothetical protein WA633_17930 [Stellaceae bacterium]
MLRDYRTILTGMAGVQAAAMAAAVTTTARFAELVLREGELTTRTLLGALAPSQALEQETWENAVASVYERPAEFFHGCAGLPRFCLLVFLGELDRRRGRRPIPPTDAD